MTVLSDRDLKTAYRNAITPFVDTQIREIDGRKIVSYGLGSYGYDVRADRQWRVCARRSFSVLDPTEDTDPLFSTHESDVLLIQPGSLVLCRTMETIDVPRDCLGICVGKSTYARLGLVCNTTPLEPEWRGRITIELSNTSPLPIRVRAGEGIAQVYFIRGASPCDVSYADRKGKYQDQLGVTLARI